MLKNFTKKGFDVIGNYFAKNLKISVKNLQIKNRLNYK